MTRQRGFSALIILFFIILLAGLSFFVYSTYIKKGTTRPNNKETSLTQTQSNDVVYAKEEKHIDSGGRRYPVYTVYVANFDGSNKRAIFTVGDTENYVSYFTLVKESNLVLVNLEHSVVAYNLKTGERKSVFSGKRGTDYIFGYAISRDGKKLAINVSNDLYHSTGDIVNDGYFKVIVADLVNDTQNTILTKSTKEVGGYWLTPLFWSKDNKIYMYEAIPAEYRGLLWEIKPDGTGLQRTEIAPGKVSGDGLYIVYSDTSVEVPWACGMGLGEDSVVKIHDLTSNKDGVIVQDSNKQQSINSIGWSPDNTQFLYTTEKYESGENCEAKFGATEAFLYDVATGKSSKISSAEDQQKKWKKSGLDVEVKNITPNDENTPGQYSQLVIDGKVIDSTNLGHSIDYLGRL